MKNLSAADIDSTPTRREALGELILAAAAGHRGADQKAIAAEGVALVETLLRKNADYGSSAWKRPILCPHADERTAILCRMSDKIARLAQLQTTQAEVAETFNDTLRDLAGYCVLLLAFEAGHRGDVCACDLKATEVMIDVGTKRKICTKCLRPITAGSNQTPAA